MDDETKPIVQVFQHSTSVTTETKPLAQTIYNMPLKRRLELDRPLTTPIKKLNSATLKRFEANANKSQAPSSIYAMDCDKFIEEIMNRPGIWNSNDINYKNKLKVKSLWEEIQQEFRSMTVDELKKRWKNLKDGYRKELKIIQRKRFEGDIDAKPSWRFFDQLCFLRDSFKCIPNDCKDNETNIYGLGASRQSPILIGSPISVDEEEEEEVENGYYPTANDSDIKEELLRMERKKMWILEEEIAKRNQYMNSDNYHFLMSLLPEMNKLGPVQKMRLRTKISQAVLDEVSLICDNEEVVKEEEKQPSPTLEIQIEEISDKTHEQEIKKEIIPMY